jgi:hypothetical protein
MNTLLTSFLDKMYWIDVSAILVIVFVWYLYILIRSKKVTERNKKYNEELYAMRAEIYTEYEKNFFL